MYQKRTAMHTNATETQVDEISVSKPDSDVTKPYRLRTSLNFKILIFNLKVMWHSIAIVLPVFSLLIRMVLPVAANDPAGTIRFINSYISAEQRLYGQSNRKEKMVSTAHYNDPVYYCSDRTYPDGSFQKPGSQPAECKF